MFHEGTHELFHLSVFHRKHCWGNETRNEPWGEAFCEAVRWLLETKHLTNSTWLTTFASHKMKIGSDKEKAERTESSRLQPRRISKIVGITCGGVHGVTSDRLLGRKNQIAASQGILPPIAGITDGE